MSLFDLFCTIIVQIGVLMCHILSVGVISYRTFISALRNKIFVAQLSSHDYPGH